MRRKKSKFEAFAQRFLIASMMLFVVGLIGVKAFEYSYMSEAQDIEAEIQLIQSNIDGLKLQKNDLTAFTRLTSIAEQGGYSYKSDGAIASSGTDTRAGVE